MTSTPPPGGARPAPLGSVGAEPDADLLSLAVLACPGVAGMHRGRYGEAATYLPRRSVAGIRIDDDEVEIHLVGRFPTPVQQTADRVHAAVATLVGARRVHVFVEDLALPGEVVVDGRGPMLPPPPPPPPPPLVPVAEVPVAVVPGAPPEPSATGPVGAETVITVVPGAASAPVTVVAVTGASDAPVTVTPVAPDPDLPAPGPTGVTLSVGDVPAGRPGGPDPLETL